MMLSILISMGAAASPPAPVPQAAGQTYAVRAAQVDLGDGSRLENAVVLVEDGRIKAAGRGVQVPPDMPVIEHGGTLTPGMIACHSYSGAAQEANDSTRSVLETASMASAFRPDHSDFERALRAGVTTLVLTPTNQNLVGGRTAVVKTAGGEVLEPRAHLALALGSSALTINRAPTSLSGAVQHLEELFSEPRGIFAEAASGQIPVLIDAPQRDDVLRAIAFARRHGLQGALNRADLAGELAEQVSASGLAVIAGPFGPGASTRSLASVVSLAQANVPLAFGLDAPFVHNDVLRMGAAQCVREGLDPVTAWKALTSDAARIAGVADRVGRLAAGLDADFVLWSGDPLDLTSSVEAVFVDGVQVHGGQR